MCGSSIAKKWILRLTPVISPAAHAKIHLRMARIVPQWHERRSRCAGHVVLCDGDPAVIVNDGDRTMVELVVLSASRSATADAEAEQKGHHKGAHPECGIGGHSFLWRRPGLRLPASANVLHQDCGGPGRSGRASGISLPPPDKFVVLTMVPCGGMPHNPPSLLRRMEHGERAPISQ